MSNTWKNKLIVGDNLKMMREQIQDETVNPIYLDLPFNYKANYATGGGCRL